MEKHYLAQLLETADKHGYLQTDLGSNSFMLGSLRVETKIDELIVWHHTEQVPLSEALNLLERGEV